MRRLPAARMLDQVIAREELRPRDVDALLGVLVPFYHAALHAAVAADANLERLRSEQAENRSVLAQRRFDLPQADALLERMVTSVASRCACNRHCTAAQRPSASPWQTTKRCIMAVHGRDPARRPSRPVFCIRVSGMAEALACRGAETSCIARRAPTLGQRNVGRRRIVARRRRDA